MLYSKALYEPLKGDKTKRGHMNDHYDWYIMHRKCVAWIRWCVNYNVFHNISKETKDIVLWKKLNSIQKSKASIQRTID